MFKECAELSLKDFESLSTSWVRLLEPGTSMETLHTYVQVGG